MRGAVFSAEFLVLFLRNKIVGGQDVAVVANELFEFEFVLWNNVKRCFLVTAKDWLPFLGDELVDR